MATEIHVSVDLETLGVTPEAVILSIGACGFSVDEQGTKLRGVYHRHITLQSCLSFGLKVDESTFHWWMDQDDKARHAITDPNTPRADLWTALNEFIKWFPQDGLIWARGQDFDIGILRTAYARTGQKHPWKYNAARDTRTLYEAVGFDDKKFLLDNTAAHDALSDATWEAKCIGAAMRKQYKLRYDLSLLTAAEFPRREDPADEHMRAIIASEGAVAPPFDISALNTLRKDGGY